MVRTIDGDTAQADWLREVLRGWREIDLADAMPVDENREVARVLRERAAHLRALPPRDSDDAVLRIGQGFATEGLLSDDLRLWLERAIEGDASAEQ